MKACVLALLLIAVTVPALGKTHKDVFDVPCSQLWPAVKDTLRNSGKYGIISIDNGEMTASYNIGGNLTGKRMNTLLLNSQGDNSCEMQIQTAFSGIANNDEGDMKKRVTASLAKLKAAAPEKAVTAPVQEKPAPQP